MAAIVWQQELSKEIFKKKYMLHEEKDEEEVFRDIAKTIGENETEEIQNQFYEIINEKEFIPAGRILANARPYSKIKNYNNCFVIDIDDSMESITQSLSDYMKILKKGGGIGFNISKLRPKRASLSTGGSSSGPLSFLEIFDQASKTIEVGGQRRGASICILDVTHPDIEDFITFKQGDENKKLTQFNISVGITKDFMKAVEFDWDWDLKWNDKVLKTVKAKDLYNKIITNAYCVSGETKIPILKENEKSINFIKIKDLDNANKYYTYSINPNTLKQEVKAIKKVLFNGQKKVVRITFNNGDSFVATTDHTIFVADKGNPFVEKTVEELEKGDWVASLKEFNIRNSLVSKTDVDFFTVLGFWVGDGSIKKSQVRFSVNNYTEQHILPFLERVAKRYNCEVKKYVDKRTDKYAEFVINSKEMVEYIEMIGLGNNEKKLVPACLFEKWNTENSKSFLRGYLTADGHVHSKYKNIIFNSKNSFLVDGIKKLFLLLGIQTNISISSANSFNLSIYTGTINQSQMKSFIDKDLFPLYYEDEKTSIEEYYPIRSFNYKKIKNRNKSIIWKNNGQVKISCFKEKEENDLIYKKVVKVEYLYKEDVYDLSIEDNHNFVDENGTLFHNCYNEPGILNIDTVHENANSHYLYKIKSTNPCFSPDTLITTKDGIFPIKDLAGKEVEIFNGERWEVINNFRKTGENESILRITLSSGVHIDTTEYHNFYLQNGEKVKAKDLKVGESLQYNDGIIIKEGISSKGAYLKGFLLADGTIDKHKNSPILFVYEPKFICENRLEESAKEIDDIVIKTNAIEDIIFSDEGSRHRIKGITCRDKNSLYKWASEYKKDFPLEVFSWDLKSKCNFIAGLMDGDGCSIENDHSFGYQFSNKNKNFIVNFLRLLNSIGIYGKISKDDRNKKIISKEKEYTFSNTYRITIPQKYAIKLSDMIKFERLSSFKDKKVKYNVKFKYNKIVDIKSIENKSDVYCCTTSTNKIYVNSGIVTGQCGEITLPPYGVCCLSAINLTKFVIDPFCKTSRFDFLNFDRVVNLGIRFLDNVLDATEYPLEQIEERALNERRIGLGITGLGSTFAMMGIEYGSEESKDLTQEIFRFLRDSSYSASIKLSAEKGPFPLFDKEKILESGFVKRLPERIQTGIKEFGLRNVAMNTIAPTGTTSLTLGENCSSGIEPIFSLEYDRNIRTENDGKIKEKVFDKSWLDFKETGKLNGSVPNFFKTALEIDPYKQIEIQAIAQEYIDNSISKTANVPQDYSIEDYKNLFNYAYQKGLKGFTTFRIGSMQGVLEVKAEKYEEDRPINIQRTHAPKRPEVLPCDIHEISVNKERHIVLVGKLNGMLYEIFVTNDPEDSFEKIGKKEGTIKKNGKGKYSLIIPNGEERIIFDNIGKEFDPTYASLSRFISMGLRHGVPLQFIVDQLNKDKNFAGFEKTVARVLKKYISEGEKVLTETCSECGGDLEYREGCMTCGSCGWSKCG